MRSRPAFAFLTGFLLLGLACGAESDRAAESATARQEGGAADAAESASAMAEEAPAANRSRAAQAPGSPEDGATSSQQRETAGFGGPRDLGDFELRPFADAEGRLLEYSLNVSYRTRDFPAARRLLYELASEYGYLLESNASAGDASVASMGATLRVKTEDMYTVLERLEKLGRLEHESIRVEDHTEQMYWQELKRKREVVRQARRARAGGSVGAAQENWAEIERLLAESEDRADQTRLETWRIRDRTAWAQIRVTVMGPELPAEVEVPRYGNAFVALANFALDLLYLAILLLPLWLAALLLWLMRGRFIALWRGLTKPRNAS